jgi:hypothetical protein
MMEFIPGKYRAVSTFSLLSLDRYHTAAGISVADGIIHPVSKDWKTKECYWRK